MGDDPATLAVIGVAATAFFGVLALVPGIVTAVRRRRRTRDPEVGPANNAITEGRNLALAEKQRSDGGQVRVRIDTKGTVTIDIDPSDPPD